VLSAAHRLRRRDEFAAVIRGGRRAARGAVVVHLRVPEASETDRSAEPAPTGGAPAKVLGRGRDASTEPAPSQPPTRAGFVVSKAVGGAVIRNTVRRRLRHLVAERIPQLPAGTAVVVRALPAAAQEPYARLGADLDAALVAARAPGRRRR
jgi:ribonuclease P protein component